MLQETTDAFDDTALEDEVRDAETDQVFDDRLTQEVEQRDASIAEPEEPSIPDEEDKEPGDSDDSHFGFTQMADDAPSPSHPPAVRQQRLCSIVSRMPVHL